MSTSSHTVQPHRRALDRHTGHAVLYASGPWHGSKFTPALCRQAWARVSCACTPAIAHLRTCYNLPSWLSALHKECLEAWPACQDPPALGTVPPCVPQRHPHQPRLGPSTRNLAHSLLLQQSWLYCILIATYLERTEGQQLEAWQLGSVEFPLLPHIDKLHIL